jgi:citrate synthase
LTIFGELPTQQ